MPFSQLWDKKTNLLCKTLPRIKTLYNILQKTNKQTNNHQTRTPSIKIIKMFHRATTATLIWKVSQFLLLIQRSHWKITESLPELWATLNILLNINLVTLTTNKKEDKTSVRTIIYSLAYRNTSWLCNTNKFNMCKLLLNFGSLAVKGLYL